MRWCLGLRSGAPPGLPLPHHGGYLLLSSKDSKVGISYKQNTAFLRNWARKHVFPITTVVPKHPGEAASVDPLRSGLAILRQDFLLDRHEFIAQETVCDLVNRAKRC